MSKKNTPTPHNAAQYGQIAKTVIMAGDPVRVKYIAENFLEDPVLYNDVRGACGYTGTYQGKKVSVQAHGMGIPSIGIYTWELFNFYDVERIIRIGTCGSYKADAKLGSLVIAEGACTDSNYGKDRGIPGHFSAIADFSLLRKAVEEAEKQGLDYEVGNVMTSDIFYNASPDQGQWPKLGVLAVEMEAYGLYFNAAVSGKKALAILTVSDNTVTGEELSASERALGMDKMIRLALNLL
ncbi:MAG: purine-nucleoside phosphorylase [Bacteroidales bacterium]|nr:purine-nucleoside phosphorylase [Bacteroidales bacterium]